MEKTGIQRNSLILIITLAAVLFVPLFILRAIGPFDFWYWMSTNLVVLISLSFVFDRTYPGILRADIRHKIVFKITLGVGSAIVLYGIFWLGNNLSRAWFDFAGEGIEGVYGFKGGAAYERIMLLMVLIIGPGEEIFWRGALQRWFTERLGGRRGFFVATIIYTGVHIFSGNIMLIVAALVAGMFWGWMYWRFRSMLANVISHTLWDVSVFLLFPFL
jgi:hypothetical protein